MAYPINSTPYAGVGAVNIQIYNPTVNGAGGVTNPNQIPQQQFVPMPPMSPPPSLPLQSPPAQVSAPPAATAITNNNQPAATTPIKEEKKADKKKKEIVQLTDDYIKTLENYLRNQSAEVRLMGTKELLKRFKEDSSRKNDKALNSLLNLTLQDPSQGVRLLGLTMVDAGYAQGDKTTVELLKQMQKSDKAYNQDAISASEALLKMAGKKISVTTDEIEEKPEKKKNGNNLDIVST
jgi:hypothetical protein